MDPRLEHALMLTRRQLFGYGRNAVGAAALASLLGPQAFAAPKSTATYQALPGLPHFPPQAKRAIYLFQSGGPSHIDLFDYKSKLIEEHGKEPLLVTPLAILDFLCIHPFSEGNGRVSRLLTLMMLYHFGYEVGRYISLERIFEQSKESYYETLEACSQGWHDARHDVRPWLNYFWGVLIRAYKEFEERVGSVASGKGSKTRQIKDAIARRISPFAISDIEADCPGISRDMVRLVLRQLRDEGVIVRRGKGRGSKWLRKEK